MLLDDQRRNKLFHFVSPTLKLSSILSNTKTLIEKWLPILNHPKFIKIEGAVKPKPQNQKINPWKQNILQSSKSEKNFALLAYLQPIFSLW